MSTRHRLLMAITSLLLFNTALAQDETGYAALTNAGYISVTATVEARSHDAAVKAEVYRDELIIEDTRIMDDESGVSSSTEHDN